MDVIGWAAWAWLLGALGLATALALLLYVRRREAGAAAEGEAGERIGQGARAFLRREHLLLAALVVVAAPPLGWATSLATAVAFVSGAVAAALGDFAGLHAAVRASARGAAAAVRGGEADAARAFQVTFFGGVVMGLSLASLGVLVIGAWYLGLGAAAITGADFLRFAQVVGGVALGASSLSLLARMGGGIYAAGANLGADLVAGLEPALAEKRARSPAVLFARVAEVVGNVAGLGADLFESFTASLVAAIALGATEVFYASSRAAAIALPVLTAVVGLLASLFALGMMHLVRRRAPGEALRTVTLAAAVLFLALDYFIVRGLGFQIVDPTGARDFRPEGPFFAILAGTVSGLLVVAATEYYTRRRRVGRVAEFDAAGVVGSLIGGLTLGLESTVTPVLLIAAAVGVGYEFAGLYGIAAAATGMLATLGITVSVHAFGPIAVNAGGIAHSDESGAEGRAVTERLAAVGRASSALGRGFAVGSAALTALALMSAYTSVISSGEGALDLLAGRTIVGLLIGAAAAFFVASLALGGGGRTASALVAEARGQLREGSGLRRGRSLPDGVRCAQLSSRSALRSAIVPGLTALLLPVAVGLASVRALGGVLMGATVTALPLALFLAHAGGGRDQAGRRIESGTGGSGHGAEARGPAAIGAVFANAAAPSLDVLMKVMGVVALVLAPLFARVHGLPTPAQETLRAVAHQLPALLAH